MGVRQATVQFRTACICGVPGTAGKTYRELHRWAGSWWETAGARGTRLACLPTSPHPSVVAMVVVTLWVMVMVVLVITKAFIKGSHAAGPDRQISSDLHITFHLLIKTNLRSESDYPYFQKELKLRGECLWPGS